jgi:hypothetical protein
MRKKSRKTQVRRITVDEKLSDGLFRFVFCSLKEGIERFSDQSDKWQKEQEKLVNPTNYSRTLGVKKSKAPAWEALQEGQVYLSGEFKIIGDPKNPEGFKVSPGPRNFLRIDELEIVDEAVKSLYSDVLGRT